MKLPPGAAATTGFSWCFGKDGSTRNSRLRGLPEAEKRRAQIRSWPGGLEPSHTTMKSPFAAAATPEPQVKTDWLLARISDPSGVWAARGGARRTLAIRMRAKFPRMVIPPSVERVEALEEERAAVP